MSVQHLLILIVHELKLDCYNRQYSSGSRSLYGQHHCRYRSSLRNKRTIKICWFFMGECIGQDRSRLGRDNCSYKQVSFSSSKVALQFILGLPKVVGSRRFVNGAGKETSVFLQGKEVFADKGKGKQLGFQASCGRDNSRRRSLVLPVSVNTDIAEEKGKEIVRSATTGKGGNWISRKGGNVKYFLDIMSPSSSSFRCTRHVASPHVQGSWHGQLYLCIRCIDQ